MGFGATTEDTEYTEVDGGGGLLGGMAVWTARGIAGVGEGKPRKPLKTRNFWMACR